MKYPECQGHIKYLLQDYSYRFAEGGRFDQSITFTWFLTKAQVVASKADIKVITARDSHYTSLA